jgi:hypothetical protein
MHDAPQITETIIANILAAGGTERERLEAIYDLGVSHGMVWKTQRAKRSTERITARATAESNTAAIVNYVSCRSDLERVWYERLTRDHYLVEYEPSRFTVMVNGKITDYTPDFRVTHKQGHDPWYLEVKPKGWPKDLPKGYIGNSRTWPQLMAMQASVKEHRIKLLVASGGPESDYKLYQALGLDVNAPSCGKTLIRLHQTVVFSQF